MGLAHRSLTLVWHVNCVHYLVQGQCNGRVGQCISDHCSSQVHAHMECINMSACTLQKHCAQASPMKVLVRTWLLPMLLIICIGTASAQSHAGMAFCDCMQQNCHLHEYGLGAPSAQSEGHALQPVRCWCCVLLSHRRILRLCIVHTVWGGLHKVLKISCLNSKQTQVQQPDLQSTTQHLLAVSLIIRLMNVWGSSIRDCLEAD